MNPYDFARIDWKRPPERRCPIWHHRLTAHNDQRLYSGQLEVELYVETPFFISDPRSTPTDPRKPAQSIKNKQGEYIIPGSSLKGMLRSLVETLGNGCLTLFDGSYERGQVNYFREMPAPFQHCDTTTNLCIACRTFGMLNERTRGVFLGKVNIGDACADPDSVHMYDPIYTQQLLGPVPHHRAFYLDEEEKHIAGRKFYFHHDSDQPLLTANGPKSMGGRSSNRYIQPLDYGTHFHVRIDFTNLESDELAALLLAVVLEDNMRHKLGFGKPLGLGTIYLNPSSLTLVDYAARYTASPGPGRGKTVLDGGALWPFIYEQFDAFEAQQLVHIAMEDLRRIWRWKPEPGVDYYYPSKRDWFDTPASRGKRIADTRDVP